MKSSRPSWIAWVFCAAFLGALLSPALAFTLTLKPEAQVSGANITVGDVIVPDPALPPELLSIPVGLSPQVNGNKTIAREVVAAAVAGQSQFGAAAWAGSDNCVVNRPGRVINAPDLAATLLLELQRATQNQGQVKIDEFAPTQPVLVPAGQIGAQAQLSPTALLHPWAAATVNYFVNGELIGSSEVRFRWSWNRQVWQASRNLAMGEDYNQADFRLTTVDAIKADGNYLAELPPADEQSISRPVPAGALLVAADLAPKKIIQRGDPVTVNYTKPNFTISMKAIALQDGARGQVISVKNTISDKSVYAKIVDASTLEVVQ